MKSVQKEASALNGAKIRQYYPDYGEGETHETRGKFGLGIFAGIVSEVWLDDKPMKGERGRRVNFRVNYEDGDEADVGFRQLTAVTRGAKDGRLADGYALAPVLLEDSLQDKKVLHEVRRAALAADIKLDESLPDNVREFARQLHVREEFAMMGSTLSSAGGRARVGGKRSAGETIEKLSRKKQRQSKDSPDSQGRGDKFIVYYDCEGSEIYRRSALNKDGTVSKNVPENAVESPDGNFAARGYKLGRSGKPEVIAKWVVQQRECERVLAGGKYLGGSVMGHARKNMADSSEDLILDEGRQECLLSLRCPISMKRLENPARGQDCSHMDCFDRDVFMAQHRKFNVTRVDMLETVFATFAEVDRHDVKVTGVDEFQRFERKGTKNVTVVNILVKHNAGQKGSSVLEKVISRSPCFIERLKAQAVKKQSYFPFVAKREKDYVMDMKIIPRKDNASNETQYRLCIPLVLADCPSMNCKKKVWTLHTVPAMEKLLRSLEDDPEREVVLVDGQYTIVGDGNPAVQRQRRPPRSVHDEVFDLSDRSTIPPLPPDLRIKVKMESGHEHGPENVPVRQPSINSLPAITKEVLAAKGQSSVLSTSAQSSLQRAPGLEQAMQAKTQSTPSAEKQAPLRGFLKNLKPRPDYKGRYGFIHKDDTKLVSEAAQNRVRDSLKESTGTPTGSSRWDAASNVDAIARSNSLSATDGGTGSLLLQLSDSSSESTFLPVSLSGNFICQMRLFCAAGSKHRSSKFQVDSHNSYYINLSHTISNASIPSLAELKTLKWRELEPSQHWQAEGIKNFAEELISNNLYAAGTLGMKKGENDSKASPSILAFSRRGSPSHLLTLWQKLKLSNNPSVVLLIAELPSSLL